MSNDIQMKIHKVWEAEQEILDVFHRVCVENDLRYSLAYGTLIGAIRHKGFIPWDDDIDVMMPRSDYDKLIRIWDSAAPARYLLQNHENEPAIGISFTKIRKDHTAFVQYEEEKKEPYHKGIFIDIFPADRVPKTKLKRKMQYVRNAVAMLYSRNYTSGAGGAMGLIERVLLKLPQGLKNKLRRIAERQAQKFNAADEGAWVFPCTIREAGKYYCEELFDRVEPAEFNGKQYYITSEYEKYLTMQYGDYMQLPPEEERSWKHHPVWIDFEHNFEESD